jgi:hypothetical protein
MSNKPEIGEQMAVLWYDISGRGSPVNDLRHCCVAVNKSVWIFPMGEIPRVQSIMQKFVREGADVDISAFVPEETDKLRRRALAALNKHAKRLLRALRKALAQSEEQLAEAERLQSADDIKKWRQRVIQAFTYARRDIAAAEECALVFQLTGDLQELLMAIRHEIKARHGEFLGSAGDGRDALALVPEVPEDVQNDNLADSVAALTGRSGDA